jgi:hypothetical protein
VQKLSPRARNSVALMHRAFGIDVLACAQCGGRLRLIATLHDPAVIRKILAHLPLGCGGGSWGGQRLRMADYVVGTGTPRGATAAAGA